MALTNWECLECTYLNELGADSCIVCSADKPFYVNEFENLPVAPLAATESMPKLFEFQPIDEIDQIYSNILADCRQNNCNFIDPGFPHAVSSLGRLAKENTCNITWLRPGRIRTNDKTKDSKWSVFTDPRPGDIVQGKLGNCWFVAALAVIAEQPELLTKIVPRGVYSGCGVYQINLCIDGVWQSVLVDDFFPCFKNSRRMVFAKGKNQQLWVSLIEKALAKVWGSYAALEKGCTLDGLAILTGANCEKIEFTRERGDAELVDVIWAKLLSANGSKYLMGASCGNGPDKKIEKQEFEGRGLLKDHAYTILDVRQLDDFKMLRLRNPWGHFAWKGDWGLEWNGWTVERKRRLYYDKVAEDPGTFWIPFDQFLRYFYRICMAHVKYGQGIEPKRVPVEISWNKPRVVKVFVFEPTEMSFSLFQKNGRILETKADLLLTVHKVDPPADGLGDYVTKSERNRSEFVKTNDLFFEPGEYVVCPVSIHSFLEESDLAATFVVHSSKEVVVDVQDALAHVLRQSLMKMALKEVKEPTVLSGNNFKLYTVLKDFDGQLTMVENLDRNRHLHIQIECTKVINVVSSRVQLLAADSVPPMSRQIVLILTNGKGAASYSYSIKSRLTDESTLGEFAITNPGAMNEPEIAGKNNVLHGIVRYLS